MNDKYWKVGVASLIFALNSYIVTFGILPSIALINSQRITSQSQLEKLLREERKKLSDGNDDFIIEAELVAQDVGSSEKLKNGHYRIKMGGFVAKDSTLRHELYHIFDGHIDDAASTPSKVLRSLKYFFVHEPQAVAYQAFGIRF